MSEARDEREASPQEAAGAVPPLRLTHRFALAVDYARHLHIERKKGTGAPAMAHLLGVASLVMGELDVPVTEDMAIAALLHDAVEDHGGADRLEDIRQNFGDEVARLVEGLSDAVAPEGTPEEPWEVRKRRYVERLRSEPADVHLISAADKLYNARALLDEHRVHGLRVWERYERSRDVQMGYFEKLLTVFRTFPSNRIVDEFERVVAELKRATADERDGAS